MSGASLHVAVLSDSAGGPDELGPVDGVTLESM